VVRQRRGTVTWYVEPTQITTHFPEALVDKGAWDVKQIADYGISLWTGWIGQTGGIASPVLEIGVGDEEGDRQEKPGPK
jgi:hypothetical protein